MVNFQEIAADILRYSVNASVTLTVCKASQRLRCREHLLGVSRYRNLRPNLGDALVGADQEGGADDPHELASVHRFFLPHSVGLDHAVLFVRCERDRKLVLGLELILRRDRVGGNAENFRSGFGEGAFEPGEINRLFRATGSIRPGIKI